MKSVNLVLTKTTLFLGITANKSPEILHQEFFDCLEAGYAMPNFEVIENFYQTIIQSQASFDYINQILDYLAVKYPNEIQTIIRYRISLYLEKAEILGNDLVGKEIIAEYYKYYPIDKDIARLELMLLYKEDINTNLVRIQELVDFLKEGK